MRFVARIVGRCGLAAVVVGLPVLIAGCGDSSGPSQDSVEAFLSRVATVGGQTATLRRGTPPAAGAGPTATSQISGAAIVGGSSQIALTSGQTFRTVIVFVQGRADYYEITLPSGVTQATLVVTLGQSLPLTAFDCVYAVADAGGTFGAYVTTRINAVSVGTGDVQISVSWNAASDVDLHVVDPANEEIYYGNEASASGGSLDLDSNAGCALDNVNNENVTWPTGAAPRGQYIVRVDYWDSCGVSQTNYVVTVRVKGRAAQTFTGSLTGTGDQGAAGSGTEVTRFTY